MRRLISVVLTAALALSCAHRVERPQTGDLLFVGIPFSYGEDGIAGAIAAATGSDSGDEINFIHTAIIEVDSASDSVWIVDATLKHGVARYPLSEFLSDFTMPDGSYPHFEVLRLKDNSNAAAFVEHAKAFLGEPYDKFFLHDNGMHYCTELVYDSYLEDPGAAGSDGRIFKAVAMNFRDSSGHMPAYWTDLFASIGAEVPQGHPGTNPQQMHGSAALCPTGVDITLWAR